MSATTAITLHCDRCQVESITVDYVDNVAEARHHASARGWAIDEWAHCSPTLLASGVDCAATPRRPCKCRTDGSHDHFTSATRDLCPCCVDGNATASASGTRVEMHSAELVFYGPDGSPMPDDPGDRAAWYRRGWRAECGDGPGAPHPTVRDFLVDWEQRE